MPTASSNINWLDKKNEILSRINIESEYSKFGIVAEGSPNHAGWVPCKNPFKKDNIPSCGYNVGSGGPRGVLKIFNSQGETKDALSFFNMAYYFHPIVQGEPFKAIIYHYAKETGVELSASVQTPPTEKDVQHYQSQITPEIRQYLYEKRGLSDESIEKYQLGYSAKRKRIAYPVYDSSGNLVNIRFHAVQPGMKPKTQGWKGYNQKRLWGIDRLVKAEPGSTVMITEGEGDSMVIEQNTGLLAVSPTNGKESFDPEWIKAFFGHHVILVWDCDNEGREAVVKKVLPIFRTPIRSGDILSLRIVWLFDDPNNKDRKDATDYFTKAGGSANDFLERIKGANIEDFVIKQTAIQEAKFLKSFEEVDFGYNAGQRVTVPLYVFGENTEAYHSPCEIIVGECKGKNNGCSGRDDWEYCCDKSIPILPGSRTQLFAISASEMQLKGALREYVCDKGEKPVVKLDDARKTTLREVYCHQVSTAMNASELIEKPVYVIGGGLLPIGQYQATGYIYAHPRNQKPTMVVDQIESQEEDWQAFDIEKSRVLLNQLKPVDFPYLLKDVAYSVTRIYERDNLHAGILFTLCSPPWIDFPSDGRIRGWISSCIIGDSGTGKTSLTEKIFSYAGVGHRVSGMTSSRTGITYACEHDEKRGWRIKAGAMPKMSGQALIIDEAQDLDELDLKTMAEAIDSGVLQVDRVQSKSFRTETRCIFSCNPKSSERIADQRTMASFRRGCTAISTVFPKMMIRRLDIVLPAASNDIENKAFAINNARRPEYLKQVVTPENLRALCYFAWNLQPHQIIISESTALYIQSNATLLSDKFGQGEDLPIVYPEDFRKTMARLCVALAVLDLSTTDDFETITVTSEHVDMIYSWIETLYSAQNFQLDRYSGIRFKENRLIKTDIPEIMQTINDHIGTSPERKERLIEHIKMLTSIPENESQKLSIGMLARAHDVDQKTIRRDLEALKTHGLVKTSCGVVATDKLYLFIDEVQKMLKNMDNLDNVDIYYHLHGLR